jgi:hypothetical protein
MQRHSLRLALACAGLCLALAVPGRAQVQWAQARNPVIVAPSARASHTLAFRTPRPRRSARSDAAHSEALDVAAAHALSA